MPTARELLEQADSLMRRNRAAAVDDIPVLTDAVPIDEALLVLPETDDEDMSAHFPLAPIPTLMERVEPPAAVTADAVMVEGEASDWLDFDQDQPSITGEAPDSIGVVPPVRLAKEPDEALLASAEHEEIELTSAAEDDFDDELTVRRELPLDSSAPEATAVSEPEATFESPKPEVTLERTESEATSAFPEHETATELTEHEAAAELSDEATAEVPHAEGFSAPETAAIAPAPASTQWDDQARWDLAAEEIRMQVLQRIDLFTDTGLREQLGQRLQPIVDRASADLVATINLHVGELLRAYVAEAIEREIERWRENVPKS
jgi:hypothetical protein